MQNQSETFLSMTGQQIDKIEQYTSAGFESIWQERENVFFLTKSHGDWTRYSSFEAVVLEGIENINDLL